MGIQGLLPMLQEIQQRRHISDFKGKRYVAMGSSTRNRGTWLLPGHELMADWRLTLMYGSIRVPSDVQKSWSRGSERPSESRSATRMTAVTPQVGAVLELF